ncbi:MAG: hypothetical protein ACF788_01230 [Novipirellula sp. JB048]
MNERSFIGKALRIITTGDRMAKLAMIFATLVYLCVGFLLFVLSATMAFESAEHNGDMHYIVREYGADYYTTSGLILYSVQRGVFSVFAITPIYLIAILICFIFWFATKTSARK